MADLTRWDPFRELTDFRDSFDRMFDRRVARPFRLLTWENGDGAFPIDLYETDDSVVVTASLPGVKADDVQVSVTGNQLSIKGETKSEHEEKEANFYRQERYYGTFQRTLTLPARVEADKADANFEDGVLKLELPKAADVKAKTIEVKANKTIDASAS